MSPVKLRSHLNLLLFALLAGAVLLGLVWATGLSIRRPAAGNNARGGDQENARLSFPNGSFETLPAGGPNDWLWPAGDWLWDGNVARDGAHSARVARSSGGDTASLWSAYVPVQPSTVYTLTYWLRIQDATWYPRVGLHQYRSDNSRTGPGLNAYVNIGDGAQDWYRAVYRFQTLPDAASIRLRIYLWTDTTGVFWFDDFALEGGAPARYPFQAGFPVAASGWVFFSSPAVADLDADGDNELLVGGGGAVDGWDDTGTLLPGYPLTTGDKTIIGQLAVADLDGGGDREIVAGTQAPVAGDPGRVFAWRHSGALLSGWPQSVAWHTQYSANLSWVSSVALADLDRDGDLEIVASTTNNATYYPGQDPPATPDLYAWRADGSLLAGNWPAWHTIAGFYGAIAAGDLSGDGLANVIAARDHHYLNAYDAAGSSLPGWPIHTYLHGNDGDWQADLRLEYGVNAPILADLEADGVMEYIVAGSVRGPGESEVHNSGVLVLEPDGARRPGWESAAVGNGIVASVDLPRQAPAVADLDADGRLEIVVATYDGWIRAYRADQTLLWAFDYTQGANLFASEPVIGDIDGDYALEIVFGTYVPLESNSDRDGPVGIWGLEADGTVMDGFPLVVSPPGVRAAPTLADLDGDGDLEILAATRTGLVFVWDTPAPHAPGWLPWPTGRHDLRRSGAYAPLELDLSPSRKFAAPRAAQQGEVVTFTTQIISNMPLTPTVRLTDAVPAGISYLPGTLTATHGLVTEAQDVLQWSGLLSETLGVEVTYQVTVDTSATQVVENTAFVDLGPGGLLTRTGRLWVNGLSHYLPLVLKRK